MGKGEPRQHQTLILGARFASNELAMDCSVRAMHLIAKRAGVARGGRSYRAETGVLERMEPHDFLRSRPAPAGGK